MDYCYWQHHKIEEKKKKTQLSVDIIHTQARSLANLYPAHIIYITSITIETKEEKKLRDCDEDVRSKCVCVVFFPSEGSLEKTISIN